MSGKPLKTRRDRYLYADRDRHGNRRHYFKPPGWKKKIRIRSAEGTPEFRAEIAQLRKSWEAGYTSPEGPASGSAGSVGWLIRLYLSSADFIELAASTQKQRRNLLKRLEAAHGHVLCADLETTHIAAIRDALREKGTPAAARNMLRAMRAIFEWGADSERKLIERNPAEGVKMPKWKAAKYARWTLDDVEKFLRFHPHGSNPRVALALILCTGQSIGDVRLMGRATVRRIDGRHVLPIKRNKTGTETLIPVLDLLRAELGERWRNLVWLEKAPGEGPYTPESLTQRFSGWAKKAGIEGKTSHGLRVSVASILAELGMSQNEIMAVLAHSTESESQGYVRDRDNLTLATRALEHLETKVSHLFNR